MSENGYKKDHGVVDQAREVSGLYKLGFELPSFLGLMLPFAVLGGSAVLGFILWKWL